MAVYLYGKFDRFKLEKILIDELNFQPKDMPIKDIKNTLYVSNFGDFRVSLNYAHMGKIQIDGEGAVDVSRKGFKSEFYYFFSTILKEIKPDGVLSPKLHYKTLSDMLLEEHK